MDARLRNERSDFPLESLLFTSDDSVTRKHMGKMYFRAEIPFKKFRAQSFVSCTNRTHNLTLKKCGLYATEYSKLHDLTLLQNSSKSS